MLKVDISGQQDIETKTWVCYQIFVTEASHPDQPKIIFWSLTGSPLMQGLWLSKYKKSNPAGLNLELEMSVLKFVKSTTNHL